MGIGYSIPANYTEEHVKKLKNELDIIKKKEYKGDYIVDIYGSLPYSYIGQTRFPEDIPDISLDTLEWYISKIHKINIPFYFVANNPWSHARERTNEGRNAIFKEIKALIDIGIDGMILANPYLIKLIHDNFPELKITASTNLNITSYNTIKNYIDFGAQYIVFGRDANRNFSLLKKLIQYFSDNLIILANTSCLLFCPLKFYHPLITGQVSMIDINSNNIKITKRDLLDGDFCFKYCMNEIANHPESILKATWIRPEDVIHYEKIGLKFLKIQGRTMSVDDQLSVLRGYFKRKTPNDDLFFIWPNYRESLLKFINNNPSPERTKFNFEIKNSELEKYGFFKYFLSSKKDCREGCDGCHHCKNIFQKISKRNH